MFLRNQQSADHQTMTAANIFFNGKVRRFVVQVALIIGVAMVVRWLINNTVQNLQSAGYIAGFDFLNARAGITIPDALIAYTPDSSFQTALLAGLVNTIVMSVACIVFATMIGFFIGLGRLSHNWLLRKLCLCYVELFRNLPPLLVIFFTYFAIFMALPDVRNSLAMFDCFFLNRRGLFFPTLAFQYSGLLVGMSLVVSAFIGVFLAWIIKKTTFLAKLSSGLTRLCQLFIICLPVIMTIVVVMQECQVDVPVFKVFNFTGGGRFLPEVAALFLALSLYTGALIAETVRSGFQGVKPEYLESAHALGLKKNLVTRLVVLPLSMRIIIPLLASQYMNLIKNTSLGVAIGFSELTRVGNSIIENKNQSIEVVFIWMLVYLGLSLLVSVLMNWFNHKMAVQGQS